jgi:hypothetical protein
MFVLLASAGWAQGIQNMEIIWMAGGVSSSSSSIAGTPGVLPGSAGFAYQLNFGYQLTSTKAGNLWLETPFTNVFQGLATFTGTTTGSLDRNGIYMTPGLRLKTPTYGLVSFYGALGGGSGSLSRVKSFTTEANGTLLANESRSIHPVADFAGGIDLRLSLRISIRAEGRDFLSAAHFGGVDGHHHPVFLAGLAFHF